jgi:hypothetical protein
VPAKPSRAGLEAGFRCGLASHGRSLPETICPGRFDQNATGVRVAGFGDRPQRARLAGGASAWYEFEKRHELLRVSEALELAEFDDQRDGGDEVNAAITLTGVLYAARHTSVRNPQYDGRQTPQILLVTAPARTAGAMISNL